MERVKREREREKFCVINVKYKEISWRVRRRRRKKENSCLQTPLFSPLSQNQFVGMPNPLANRLVWSEVSGSSSRSRQ